MGRELDCDVSELMAVFGEALPLSNEELGDYWFRYERPDGITVTFDFSTLDRSVGVIVRASPNLSCAAVTLPDCEMIRVLEPGRKTLEVITSTESEPRLRCFLALDAESIMYVGPVEDE